MPAVLNPAPSAFNLVSPAVSKASAFWTFSSLSGEEKCRQPSNVCRDINVVCCSPVWNSIIIQFKIHCMLMRQGKPDVWMVYFYHRIWERHLSLFITPPTINVCQPIILEKMFWNVLFHLHLWKTMTFSHFITSCKNFLIMFSKVTICLDELISAQLHQLVSWFSSYVAF